MSDNEVNGDLEALILKKVQEELDRRDSEKKAEALRKEQADNELKDWIAEAESNQNLPFWSKIWIAALILILVYLFIMGIDILQKKYG